MKFLQKDIDKFKKMTDKRKDQAATDKGSFYNQQAWLEEYTCGEGLYYKDIVTVVIFFSDVESSHGESESDSDYFEEPLKNNKEIKIDYGST